MPHRDLNRRDLLKLAQSGLVASAASVVIPSFALAQTAKKDKRPVALLVPLTGPRARLGLSMRSAALLAENSSFVQTYDTLGTANGAAAAATAALKKGPAMILGPLLAEEVPAVASTVAGRVPVICFSNDSVLKQPGTYIFGITAAQVTSAILRYARTRGVKSVVVIDDHSPWSSASVLAASRMEGELGITVRSIEVLPGSTMHDPGEVPDAVLLPGSGDKVLAAARALKETGVQLLGTVQALDHRPASLAALEGAWIASPDPAAFGTFASEFSARVGGDPGAIAALAYDAAGIANSLRNSGTLSPAGLLSAQGFKCVTGPVRFRTDGSVARDFAILVARPEGYEPVAMSSGA
ncbi:ABC transporter substrate-binding protein [Sphingomonas sp. AOB5]|uniref:ABC transporter substrate-binding protein n=1 Tax=Sphingomonas sp. AOB5 TaxID=3034017 RepID=UPI0023F62C84|nr:ABC transporter substrate-binding protein [Sphingomonas sp. AOB5]MDF7777725.1 ABC transporter substrate-binding protein [Sphingomonas sp. AOB5]